MDISTREETLAAAEDQRWLGTAHGTQECESITLDRSLFTTLFPDGRIPSGTVLGKITATGKYGPYSGTSEEVQSLAISATGGTYTLTFDGQTTTALAYNANAAAIQAALEALSNVAVGDVVVTGTGPYTITFGGAYANTNVSAITTDAGSLTGGAGTATITTTTAGGADSGSDGRQVAKGILYTTVKYRTDADVDPQGALYWHGQVRTQYLPTNNGLDPNAIADLKHIDFV